MYLYLSPDVKVTGKCRRGGSRQGGGPISSLFLLPRFTRVFEGLTTRMLGQTTGALRGCDPSPPSWFGKRGSHILSKGTSTGNLEIEEKRVQPP